MPDEPICFRCRRPAGHVPEVVALVSWRFPTAAAVARADSTFNLAAGTFACSPCLAAVGGPALVTGWKAPAALPPRLSHAVLHGEAS